MENYSEKWMARALEFAKEGWGTATPNPSVGAVAVKDGEFLGGAPSQPGGGPHAEATLLRELGEKAKGADLFVTLEPCSHFGKNPPCTLAIQKAKIKRVFVAIADENPQVSGNDLLRREGIEVQTGILKEQAEAMYSGFFHFIKTGRTRVVVKIAETQNGVMAKKDGPLAITGSKANEYTGFLRGRAQAIVVSTRTAQIDNPRLNLHSDTSGWIHPPKPVLFGRNTPNLSKPNFEKGNRESRAFLFSEGELVQNFSSMVLLLSQEGIHEIFVEPGPKLAKALVQAGVWDHLHIYQSKNVVEEGISWRSEDDSHSSIPGELVNLGPIGDDTHFFFTNEP